MKAAIDAMQPHEKAQLSADWLERFSASSTTDPWLHGFSAEHRQRGVLVGTGGFKGPPAEGAVEIAYGVAVDQRGNGYVTETGRALVAYAIGCADVSLA